MKDRGRRHAAHDDAGSPRSQRLRAVRGQLEDALDRCRPGRIRLLSLCAGRRGTPLFSFRPDMQ